MRIFFRYFSAIWLWNFVNASMLRERRASGPGSIPLSDTQKMDILNLHNKLRRSSGSSNMRYLTWDSQLAWLAESYGRKCRYRHNEDRQHSRYHSVGENIFASNLQLSQFQATKAVQMWFDEVANFDYVKRTCRPGKSCGHYTQIVWATTFKVGCALTACDYLSEIQLKDSLLFICNYATSGNVVNRYNKLYQIFKKGKACSKCNKTDYCRDSLCANSKRDFIEMPTCNDYADGANLGLIIAVAILCVIVIALVGFIIYRERKRIFPRRFFGKQTIKKTRTVNRVREVQPRHPSQPEQQPEPPQNSYVMQRLLAEDKHQHYETPGAPTPTQVRIKTAPVKPKMPPPSVPAPVLVKR